MIAPNYLLIASDKLTLVGSHEAGIAESKKHGKCRLYRLELVDVLNANKAALVAVETETKPAKKKAK
jgi:hypothetical protein